MTATRGRPRVLLIDDEPAILAAFRRAFRGEIDLITEIDPARGLAVIESEDIDVLFVDYSMPGMTGLRLLERVREVKPQLRAYLVTAHAMLECIDDAVKRGLVTAVIRKPWSHDEIRLRFREIDPPHDAGDDAL